MHNKKNYIYTIQNATLSIYLFEITSPIGDALTISFFRVLRYILLMVRDRTVGWFVICDNTILKNWLKKKKSDL